MTADEALHALVETLDQLRWVLPPDKASWDSDVVLRLAVERLWITAGNAADEYRRAAGIDIGLEPDAGTVTSRRSSAGAERLTVASPRPRQGPPG